MIKKLQVLFWHNFFMDWLEKRVVKLDNLIWRNRWDKHRKDGLTYVIKKTKVID